MNDASHRSRRWGWIAHEAGASATEFALVLPLLALLLFGFVEVGRLIWSYSIVNASVRSAARYAARLSMDCSSFTDAASPGNIQRLTRTGTIVTGGTPLLPNWTSDSTVTITIGCVDNSSATYAGLYSGVSQIPTVTVTAQAPYTSELTTLLPALNLSTITATHSEAWTQQ